MREQASKVTFVSPLSYDAAVIGGKRVLHPYFYLLQPGSDPLKLEYASKVEAKSARSQLLQSPESHSVPKMAMFWAIKGAFDQLVDA